MINSGVILTSLPDDAVNRICSNLSLHDMYNVIQVCNRLGSVFCNCDLMWYEIACREYSKEFWDKASKRNKKISLPEGSFYKELKRLKNFESMLLKEGFNLYTIEQYYFYWETLES